MQIIGLILNLIGALILGFVEFTSFSWKSGSLYAAVGNVGRAIRIIRIIGFLLLILGFLFQILAVN